MQTPTIVLTVIYFAFLQSLPINAFSVGDRKVSNGSLSLNEVHQSGQVLIPRLRILIVCDDIHMMHTHLALHRSLAELLASDEKNVEKVVLLAIRYGDGANEVELDTDRLTIMFRNVHGKNIPQPAVVMASSKSNERNPWIEQHEKFVPKVSPNHDYTEFATNNVELYDEFRKIGFNVGIVELIRIFGNPFIMFGPLPTIKTYVGTTSVIPSLDHWKLLGYTELFGKVPGLNMAKIGDHKYVPNELEGNSDNLTFLAINRRFMEHSAMIDADNVAELKKVVAEKRFQWVDDEGKPLGFQVEDGIKRMAYFYINSQPYLDFPFVEKLIERKRKQIGNDTTEKNAQKIRYFGGISMRPMKLLQLDSDTLELFNDPTKNGVILVSFGSVVEVGSGDKNSLQKEKELLEVFTSFSNVNFIWKYGPVLPENSHAPYNRIAPNVYAKGWVQQEAILAQAQKQGTKIQLFITHCGMNSVLEATRFGVPMICFPFFGDQYNNAEAMASRGAATVLDIRANDMEKKLAAVLNDLLIDNSETYAQMKANILELSQRFKKDAENAANDFKKSMGELRKLVVPSKANNNPLPSELLKNATEIKRID